MIRSASILLLVFSASCGVTPDGPPNGGAPLLPADGELPCEAANLVVTHCLSCHGATPAGGATFSLIRRSDFTVSSPIEPTQTIGQRAVTRMKAVVAPMPPAPAAPAAPTAISAFDSWVTAGMPAGACATPTIQTTCTSNASWAGGLDGSQRMFPGLACRSCHLGQNFLGQNPRGVSQPEEAYVFSGTLYPGFHEANSCNGISPTGAVIEILDNTGAVAFRLTPNSVGNFHSSRSGGAVGLPYTARVNVNGAIRAMATKQTDGDCNTCHTEAGLNGAPGRIVSP